MEMLDHIALVQSRMNDDLGVDMSEQDLLQRALRFADLGLSECFQRFLNPLVGIVSLTADPLVPTMWAHYASNTGIVVGYDTETLRGLGYELRKVTYSAVPAIYEPAKSNMVRLDLPDHDQIEADARSASPTGGIRMLGSIDLARLDDHWKSLSRLLFVKGRSWAYEQEVRLLVDLRQTREVGIADGNDWPVRVIDIPPDAIREIYCGARTRPEDIARAEALARQRRTGHLTVSSVRADGFKMHKTGSVRS